MSIHKKEAVLPLLFRDIGNRAKALAASTKQFHMIKLSGSGGALFYRIGNCAKALAASTKQFHMIKLFGSGGAHGALRISNPDASESITELHRIQNIFTENCRKCLTDL